MRALLVPRDIWQSMSGAFWVVTAGRETTGIGEQRAQGVMNSLKCSGHLLLSLPQTENYPAPQVNSAEGEEPKLDGGEKSPLYFLRIPPSFIQERS